VYQTRSQVSASATLFRQPINVRDPREITIRGYQWKSIPPSVVSATRIDRRRRRRRLRITITRETSRIHDACARGGRGEPRGGRKSEKSRARARAESTDGRLSTNRRFPVSRKNFFYWPLSRGSPRDSRSSGGNGGRRGDETEERQPNAVRAKYRKKAGKKKGRLIAAAIICVWYTAECSCNLYNRNLATTQIRAIATNPFPSSFFFRAEQDPSRGGWRHSLDLPTGNYGKFRETSGRFRDAVR